MVRSSTDALIPVDLVTGFLGSGKTTLINAVLKDRDFAGAMVIVNEFGEVGLDHLLVSACDDQVLLLASGCLCCAATGGLRDTLIDLFARRSSGRIARFHRIVVETSGLAHPGPLVTALIGDSALATRCRLAQVLTLVDAANGAATLTRHAEARLQVAMADRLVVSKLDTASDAERHRLETVVAAMNPQASLTQWQRTDPAKPVFDGFDEGSVRGGQQGLPGWCRPLRPQYAHREASHENGVHGDTFAHITTHTLHLPDPVDWATYAAWTRALSARFGRRLLRCKGMLALGDDFKPWVVQAVQGYFASPELWEGGTGWPAAVPVGFLVCIGESIQRAELEAIVFAAHPVH